MRHDSFICATWRIRMCDRLMHMYDMTHSHVWYVWCLCPMTHSYVRRDVLVCVTWRIQTHSHVWYVWCLCPMTHSYVWYDSFIRVTWCGSHPHRRAKLKISGSPDLDGFPVHSFEWWELRGLPRWHVWYVRGLPRKLVVNFDSFHYFKSDLLRLWSACVRETWQIRACGL